MNNLTRLPGTHRTVIHVYRVFKRASRYPFPSTTSTRPESPKCGVQQQIQLFCTHFLLRCLPEHTDGHLYHPWPQHRRPAFFTPSTPHIPRKWTLPPAAKDSITAVVVSFLQRCHMRRTNSAPSLFLRKTSKSFPGHWSLDRSFELAPLPERATTTSWVHWYRISLHLQWITR